MPSGNKTEARISLESIGNENDGTAVNRTTAERLGVNGSSENAVVDLKGRASAGATTFARNTLR